LSGVELRIWHLYPSDMNIYGDRGNVIALLQRARWRGVEATLRSADVGEPIDPGAVDLVFAGGGQDDQQVAVARDLPGRKGELLRGLAEEDVPMLLVCGTYQLFGHYFRTGAGDELPGIGLLDLHTVAGTRRLIGDALVETEVDLPEGSPTTLVGFENHSGQSFLGPGCRRLGRVVVGGGNNGRDGGEGAVYRWVHGTYLHGPILPKNPWLTDRLLLQALRRRGWRGPLPPLDDRAELAAHRAIAERTRRGGRRKTGVV
jgi:CobQ-like glutamine amidotransferase family enzyme